MRRLIAFGLSLSTVLGSPAWACNYLFLDPVLTKGGGNLLTLKDVEVIRPNNNVGIQQVGKLDLDKWIDIAPEGSDLHNDLGLTNDGRIYHVVQWKDRKIARLLSGQRVFKDIYIFKRSALVAIGAFGDVFMYSPTAWRAPKTAAYIKQGLASWGALSAMLITALYAGLDLSWGEIVAYGGFGTVTGLFTTGFVMAQSFDRENTYPDGFVKTDFRYQDDRTLAGQLASFNPATLPTLNSFDPPNKAQLDERMPEEAQEDIRK